MSQARQALGSRGERLAAAHLEGLGYRLVHRNWRCRYGEIDLVARDGDTLVIVEVRTRRGARFGRPEESVDRRKQARLARLAQTYVQTRRWTGAWRVDVVAIEIRAGAAPELRHYPAAIGP